MCRLGSERRVVGCCLERQAIAAGVVATPKKRAARYKRDRHAEALECGKPSLASGMAQRGIGGRVRADPRRDRPLVSSPCVPGEFLMMRNERLVKVEVSRQRQPTQGKESYPLGSVARAPTKAKTLLGEAQGDAAGPRPGAEARHGRRDTACPRASGAWHSTTRSTRPCSTARSSFSISTSEPRLALRALSS